jgi:hypothetical protein
MRVDVPTCGAQSSPAMSKVRFLSSACPQTEGCSFHRCEMKNLNFATELHLKLGAPASHTVESLRLLRAFLRLAPRQRFEVIKLVEDLAGEEISEHPLA